MNKKDFEKKTKKLELQHIKDQQKIKILETEKCNAKRREQRKDRKIAKMKKENETMNREFKKLKKEYQKLTRYLKKYDNAHSPPSQRCTNTKMGRRTPQRANGEPKKQGGQPGHIGTTDSAKPSKIERHDVKKCPNCNSKYLKLIKKWKRIITEIIKPAEIAKIMHELFKYECEKCGKHVESDVELPKTGKFGKNIIAEVNAGFIERLPYRLIEQRLERMGIPISHSTVYSILKKTGLSLHDASQNILNRIRKARTLHVDETSMRLHGKKVWMWIFLDPVTNNMYYVIRNSRGSNVPKSVLAGWNGTLVCDGWKAYLDFEIQRCWAHILREAREINYKYKLPATKEVEDELYAIFQDGVDAKGNLQYREKLVKRLQKKTLDLVELHIENELLTIFLKKVRNAVPDLFRYVIDPRIPPTNNAAERGLREPIVQRKMRGTMRAEDSLDWVGNIFTCDQTWKAQGSGLVENVKKYV